MASIPVAGEAEEEIDADHFDDIRESPRLSADEKQTALNFLKTQSEAYFETWESSLIRRFLNHDESIVEKVTVYHDDDSQERIAVEDYESGDVVAVAGKIPISCLKISSNSRDSDGHSYVISGY